MNAINKAVEKYEKLIAGDKYAYVNEKDWGEYCLFAIDALKKLMQEGR